MDNSQQQEALELLLATSLASSGIPPLINAEQAANLVGCSKEHIEGLADRGKIPATKYGRGWVFVTAQLVLHVAHDAAKNVCKTDRPPRVRRSSKRRRVDAEASYSDAQTVSEARLTVEPVSPPQKRGRPRFSVPDITLP